MQHLKKIRLALGLAILIILLLAFLGIKSIVPPQFLFTSLTQVQLIPALLKGVAFFGVALIIASGLIVITYLFGRIYCSVICPLGTFQDIISRLGKKMRHRKIYRYSTPKNKIRYIVFSIVVLSLITGSTLLLNLLDPYSNFGKISSGLFRPVAVFINDGISKMLEAFDLYWIDPVGIKSISIWLLLFPFIFFVIVFIMSFLRGRLFCNTICPVGSLLGLFSRYSLFKIKINETTCTRCGKCSTVCKAECIDVKTKKIDFSRCVACYNCLKICPDKSITYKISQKAFSPISEQPENNSRRAFFTSLAVIATTGTIFAENQHRWGSKKKNKNAVEYEKKYPVCPPGSLSLENFNTRCTACHLCVSSCPTHVLQPSLTVYGLAGFMQPHLDFNKSFCNYECTKCSEVCPTGAILPLTTEGKKLTQIGKVVFIKENCIVYTDETSCGACSEHCPTKAVAMVPYKGTLTIPETNEKICVGCGACEYACPVRPFRAIYVEGNSLHLAAMKPEGKKAEGGEMEEFPF